MALSVRLSERAGSIFIESGYDPAWVEAVRELPGRRFHGDTKCWSVPRSSAAALASLVARLGDKISVQGLELVEQATEQHTASVEQSRAATVDAAVAAEIPAPAGLEYLPYQRAGIAYAMSRKNTMIGDEMGLGKTIQAIGVVNADSSIKQVAIICPASLKLNWKKELERWSVRPARVVVSAGTPALENWAGLFSADEPGSVQCLVLNYDIVHKWHQLLTSANLDLLVLDEAHYLKNGKAKRTAHILGRWDQDPEKRVSPIAARRKIALSGTPIPNRPIEIWPLVHALAPSEFGGWRDFVVRYCAGHQGKYGWEVDGASNLGELQEKLRASIMVRRKKADVLTELPAKRRQIVELEANKKALKAERTALDAAKNAAAALKAARAIESTETVYAEDVERLREAHQLAFAEISRVRHETALAKLPAVIEHLADCLEDSTRKLIVFAHHRDVISGIVVGVAEALGSSRGIVTVTGETPSESRQQAVERFQTDKTCRVFVGNILAAGTGLTLTASSHVIFAELDWVPGNVTQAEDRAHRIGQTDSVLIQHLVMDGSIDAKMARTLVEKQGVIDRALDQQGVPVDDGADILEEVLS